MNLAHVHLLLNHVPTIGFSIGLILLFVSYTNKSDDIKRVSLVVLFMVALLAIPTYVTGNAAEAAIRDNPNVAGVVIRTHEDAALLAFVFIEITGFFAWLALWQWRSNARLQPWNMTTVLIASLIAFGLVVRAATLGGEITHLEIRSPAQAAAIAAAPEDAGEVGFTRELGFLIAGGQTWIWPAAETLHFIGLCLLFTAVLIVDLRMLGMIKRVPFSSLYQLLPLGMLGFGINLVTGMMFFIGSPGQYIDNVTFVWKIVFIVLAGINVLYFLLFDEPWEVGRGDDAPLRPKLVAASAIFLWVGVLFFGHMLPFIGNAF